MGNAESGGIDYLDTLIVVRGLPGMVSVQPEKQEPSAKIYPNPSSGEVFVEVTSTMIGGTIRVYSVLGNLAIQQAIGKEVDRLDLSALPKGLYFIEVVHESRRQVLKCLLE
ncbi:MAG: T9SS type A sorting domain-containing protein [Saprospiraceae bacterium]